MNTRLQTVRRIGLGSIAIGLPVLVGATGTAAADGSGTTSDVIGCWGGTGGSWGMMGGGWGMGGSGGWGMGTGLFGGWGMLLWPLLLLGLVALVVYALGNRGAGTSAGRATREPDRAMVELRERYARGELSEEEFERKRRTLEH